MNILLIGDEANITKVANTMHQEYVADVLLWSDCVGVNELLEGNIHNSYDVIIVCADDAEMRETIYDTLTIYLNISPDRIIDFYKLYMATIPMMNVDAWMMKRDANYEGLIFGISHAEVGIAPKLLPYSFANLAVGSQDLYYNFKTFEYCINKYQDRIVNLKHVIIDLFDYTYFNYDVSMSKEVLNYIIYGGYNLDKHNFDLNKNVNYTFDDAIYYVMGRRYERVNDANSKLWAEIFGNIHDNDGYSDYTKSDRLYTRNRIVDDTMTEEYYANRPISRKRFDATIAENKEIFVSFLKRIKEFNSKIEITCLLMPKHRKTYEKAAELNANWKNEFMTIINEAQQKVDFDFWDFTEDEISLHAEYYFDAAHLNYLGAMEFTKKINEKILSKGVVKN